jgi:vacuolar-type H+-ATPase subunit E/Vma4
MRCNNNFCFHTYQLNKYLQECEERESEQEFINEEAREKAEELISAEYNSDSYQSVLIYINDCDNAVEKFDELVHNVVNNPTVESVQKLQEFMNEVAFEVAKKEISEKINKLKIYGCDIDDVQYQDDDPFYI